MTGLARQVAAGETGYIGSKDCRSLARFNMRYSGRRLPDLQPLKCIILIDANGILQVAAKGLRKREEPPVEVAAELWTECCGYRADARRISDFKLRWQISRSGSGRSAHGVGANPERELKALGNPKCRALVRAVLSLG